MTFVHVPEDEVHPLDAAEQAHVDAFAATRPDWNMIALAQRLFDEDVESREHKYARAHPYVTGMQFVLQKIIPMAPCKVLDIGSPISQNAALACMPGVDVTVLDIRPSADAQAMRLDWKLGSATALPFPDASWAIITSLWVMGHVGDGRYGDAYDVDGDRKMLREIARVLAPGGTAIIGPGLISEACGNIFNLHRIYTWEWLATEFARAGLKMVEHVDLYVEGDVFLSANVVERRDGVYGLAVLTK